MDTIVKNWRDNNKDKVKLQKKREKVRKLLRKHNILPQVGDTPNEEQQIILDQISNNDFSYYHMFKLKKPLTSKIEKPKMVKKRIRKESKRPILKRARIIYELRSCGIIPPVGEPLNQIQQEILDYVTENYEIPIKSFITKHKHLTSPEYSIWYRVKRVVQKEKNRRHGDLHFNLTVEDIIIPEKCPYLNIDLLTDIKYSSSPNYYTIDRIDSSKGYIKGNIQIISRLANTMKNNATKEELITFANNILKLHNS